MWSIFRWFFCHVKQVHRSHKHTLKRVPYSYKKSGITPSLAQSKFVQTGVVYVGHSVGNGRHRPAKLQAMMSSSISQNKKQVRQALGASGFYWSYIEGYAEIAEVLTDLTGKNKPNRPIWTDKGATGYWWTKAQSVQCTGPRYSQIWLNI